PEFMRQLDRIDVMSRKILRGRMQGERRSKKKGQSVEFADYRNYVVGDDLRFIDWNLYARLDKLFLRLFMEEEDLSVSVAIDTTASMDWGEPNKLTFAKQLAAALGYMGLVHYNRVNLYGFTDTITGQMTGLRGRRPIPRMLEFLRQQQPPDTTDPHPGNLLNVAKRIALVQRQPGVVILLSDFFDKGELSDALRYLSDDRHDVYAIQVLAPQEVDPTRGEIVGDLRLRDKEDGDVAEVSITPALLKRYKANLQAYCNHVRDQCLRRGIAYMVSETDVPLEDVVLKYLRRRGLVG
ncbi:MAG: DUF58 domain-containing protein, partial [Phycisphaeraceae bacterium]